MAHGTTRGYWKIAALVAIALLIVVGWTLRHRFEPVVVGSMAPAYRAKTLDGREVSLASLRGKVVILNAWATWCAPCVREMPALQRAYEKLRGEGLEVVAVSVDAPIGGWDPRGNAGGDIKAFAEQYGLTFPILHDPERRIEQTFSLYGLPTTLVIDRSGRIAHKVVGPAEWDDEPHIRNLRELLAKRP
jgi:peroxiredoxin